jgi:hypothetical protein
MHFSCAHCVLYVSASNESFLFISQECARLFDNLKSIRTPTKYMSARQCFSTAGPSSKKEIEFTGPRSHKGWELLVRGITRRFARNNQEGLFFIVGGGGASTRRPLNGLLYLPGWLWWWRIWWNEDWQEKPKYSEKSCPSATLSTTNPTWPDPGATPGRRGGKPATNRLSYGAALRKVLLCVECSLFTYF